MKRFLTAFFGCEVVVITALLVTTPTPALTAQGCQMPANVPDRRIVIDWVDAGVDINDRLSPSQIAALGQTAAPPGVTVRGLTAAQTVLGVRSGMAIWEDGRGGVCVTPTIVTVRLGFAVPQRVYIQAGYAEGSCERRAIYEHELGHVRINRDTLIQHVSRVQYAAHSLLGNYAMWPMRVGSRQEAGRAVTENFRKAVSVEMEYYQNRRDAMHAQLDTPQNYRATANLCSDW